MQLILALLIGGAFGFVLDRIGATNPSVLGKMLSFMNLSLMKTILLAIGTGSILMFGGQMAGLVDVGHMSVKSAYTGVFIGGLLLGFGWALSGMCPGTGVVAAATGRLDALAYLAGGLLGAAAYMATYPAVKATGVLNGEKLTLGEVPGAKYDALLSGVPGDVLGIALGTAFVLIAFLLPEKPRGAAVGMPAE